MTGGVRDESRALQVFSGRDAYIEPQATDTNQDGWKEASVERDDDGQDGGTERSGRPTLSEAERFDLALGISGHAIYHAGQVQLLKRLRAE